MYNHTKKINNKESMHEYKQENGRKTKAKKKQEKKKGKLYAVLSLRANGERSSEGHRWLLKQRPKQRGKNKAETTSLHEWNEPWPSTCADKKWEMFKPSSTVAPPLALKLSPDCCAVAAAAAAAAAIMTLERSMEDKSRVPPGIWGLDIMPPSASNEVPVRSREVRALSEDRAELISEDGRALSSDDARELLPSCSSSCCCSSRWC
ncbi:hypothetical protein CAOG_009399 [Capsaspora owczarzaki ATCC 30864]|uniref:Uncharacterized protein n=1 Tax=Capsaspora owczarzaki (strain ATCC 30864) TaxID=595528 RepID=A0A0D2WK10_CAPO3|nr:hypothetical protein CAOG_009399 [Capsaspora owczarzaki ATCC 30864]